jgi:hypothetical protein
MNSFSNKNQKDKEQIFIFLMKKTRWLYDEIKYFLKIPVRDTVGPISRGLKHQNWQGVSQYLWWVLYKVKIVMQLSKKKLSRRDISFQ